MANSEPRSPVQAPPESTAQARPRDSSASRFSESEFLALLGERVRGMRVLCEMSRRELARRSGISERYLAQIEAGKGNVSIILLLRIAQAIRGGSDNVA